MLLTNKLLSHRVQRHQTPDPSRPTNPILQETKPNPNPATTARGSGRALTTGLTQTYQTCVLKKRHPRSASTSNPQRIPAPRLQLLLLLATHNCALQTRQNGGEKMLGERKKNNNNNRRESHSSPNQPPPRRPAGNRHKMADTLVLSPPPVSHRG